MKGLVFVLDNYDSFTFNLVQMIGDLGYRVKVARNDQMTTDEIQKLSPTHIVISPGPCTPKEAGISIELIQKLQGMYPILGVCLGHQSIAEAFGGKVIRAPEPIHGKLSSIFHDGKTIFKGIPLGFSATRYHSLIVEKETLPSSLEISAWTEEGLIMGIRHKTFPIEGIQFHPESVLTEVGREILLNFFSLSGN